MQASNFDELTKALAATRSRRHALRLIVTASVGSLFGLGGITTAFGRHKVRNTTSKPSGPKGNSNCADWCARVFGPNTSAAGQCTSDAAHGGGLCAQCGNVNPSSICCVRNTSGYCNGTSAATCCASGQHCCNGTCNQCCANSDCIHGNTCGSNHTCVCGSGAGCTGSNTCIAGSCCPDASVCVSVCCASGQLCCSGTCAQCCVDNDCPIGQTCQSGTCGVPCTPNCTNKTCGDDGCGGSCGSCPSGQTCVNGVCLTPCTPDCTGKTCGDNGCGGSCGTCSSGQTCVNGACCDNAGTACMANGDCCSNVCCNGICCGANRTCSSGTCVRNIHDCICNGSGGEFHSCVDTCPPASDCDNFCASRGGTFFDSCHPSTICPG